MSTIINKQLKLAKRYATALLKLDNYHEILKELEEFSKVLSGSHDLVHFLENKIITKEDKKDVLNQVLKGNSPNVINFLSIIIDGDKFDHFHSILHQFEHMVSEKSGALGVQIISAIELDNDDKEKIIQKLEKKLSKKIKPHYLTDSKILAGLIIKIGDKVIDTSQRGKIDNLKKHLM